MLLPLFASFAPQSRICTAVAERMLRQGNGARAEFDFVNRYCFTAQQRQRSIRIAHAAIRNMRQRRGLFFADEVSQCVTVDDRHAEARHRVTERVARVAQQPHAGRFSSIGDDHIRRLAPCPRRAVAEHDGKQQIRRPRRDQEDAPRQVCRHNAARKARHRPQTLP